MTKASSHRRPPPARANSASPSPAGPSASSSPTCAACPAGPSRSAGRPCAPCCTGTGSLPAHQDFQRIKTWKESPDPDFDAKLDQIEYALTQRLERTFAFDEFGPLGIRPTAGTGWAPQGEPDRLPATYRRTQGVTCFHGRYSVGDDRLWGVNRARKGIDHTWAALKSIRAARPGGVPIYVILEKLSAHKNWRIRTWAKKNKVKLLFTPTYASWANPIEAHFGPLRQFTLANSDHPNHTVLTRALHAYPRWRNAHTRHPDVLAAQRRERARIRSEKGIRWGGRPLTPAA